MTRVMFIEASGATRAVEAPDGATLMRAAVEAGVEGILADCGGACSCATCHVQVEAPWQEVVGGPSDLEASMLEFAEEVAPHSRLACQIKVSPSLDGLTVRVAASQT